MKTRSVLFLLTFLTSVLSYAQSNVSGRISLSGGFDVGGHYVTSEAKYNGTVIGQDTTGAVTKLFQFNGHYSITNWFSAGLGFRVGSYVEDPDDPENAYKSNSVSEVYLDTRFYFVNRNKFNMYGGFSLGSTTLNLNYNKSSYSSEEVYKTSTARFQIGLNWYITKYVGFWYNMDYAGRTYELSSWKLNGASQDLSNFDYAINTKGAHFAFGLCFKFKE